MSRKRKLSGWNCFLKTCVKTGMGANLHECLTNDDLKNREYKSKKDYWNEKAKEGCPL